MSKFCKFQCLIGKCKQHDKVIEVEFLQAKNHIKYDHDYKEKQEKAFELGLISNIEERRSSEWFAEQIAAASILK